MIITYYIQLVGGIKHRGGSRDYGKDQKVGFTRNEEAIKNALKCFISKKVVFLLEILI